MQTRLSGTSWEALGCLSWHPFPCYEPRTATNQGAKGTFANFLNRNRIILAFRPTFILRWCFKYNTAQMNLRMVILLCLFAWPGNREKILEGWGANSGFFLGRKVRSDIFGWILPLFVKALTPQSRWIPSFFIFSTRVVRCKPSRAAALATTKKTCENIGSKY